MKVTIEQKKIEAIARMKLLNLHPNVIREFESETLLNLSESGGFLYWLTDEQKEHVSAFEREYSALVYHAIHDYTEFGELFTFLYVSDHQEEWEADREELRGGYACAYVKNLDDDCCSELGGIPVYKHNVSLPLNRMFFRRFIQLVFYLEISKTTLVKL